MKAFRTGVKSSLATGKSVAVWVLRANNMVAVATEFEPKAIQLQIYVLCRCKTKINMLDLRSLKN